MSPVTSAGPVPECPLCGSQRLEPQGSISYVEIWGRLARDWEVPFSEGVRLQNSPASAASLLECGRCGLLHFDPIAPGDSGFYTELMSAVDYEEHRWEFEVVAALVPRTASIVDLGCGSGAFLRGLEGHAGVRVGVDRNDRWGAMMTSKGVTFVAGDVSDLQAHAGPARGPFDAVCAFQLIEHLADPVELVRQASRSLAPHGRLYVAVPNRRRRVRTTEVLDCPPHHVTRWDADQLLELANQCGLRLVGVHCQRVPARFLARVPRAFFRGHRLLAWCSRRIPASFRRASWRTGPFGHTMLAAYELRDDQ